MELSISFLADRPEALATVALWVHSEWGHKFGASLKQMEDGFRGRLHRDRIPFTLVGELDGKLVGTSTVVACDLPARRDLRPWLAAVFVDPACRGKGVGSALVQAACSHVAKLGNEHVYLYTESAAPFYARLGWTALEQRTYHGDEVSVMAYDLDTASSANGS
jgi:predicted N-acetyltransferase YhbS